MKSISKTIQFPGLILLLFFVLNGCSMLNQDGADVYQYNQRTLEYMYNHDDDTDTDLVVEKVKVYDGTSLLQKAETEYTYDINGKKTETLVYACDPVTGKKNDSPGQTIEFTYSGPDIVTGITSDSDGNPVMRFNISYSALLEDDGVHHKYTDVTYQEYDGGSWTTTSEEIYTYYDGFDPEWDGNLRTEQYFYYEEGTRYLDEETAYWYDGNDGSVISHLLKHSVRGDGGDSGGDDVEYGDNGELYIYKEYSYNTNGQVYLISDFEYDHELAGFEVPITTDAGTDNDYFNVIAAANPFNYDINYDSILDQKNMVIYDYSELEAPDAENGELLVEKVITYTSGELQEKVVFAYDADKRMVSEARYINGGRLLSRRDVINYRDVVYEEDDNGDEIIQSYIKETYEYSFDETDSQEDEEE